MTVSIVDLFKNSKPRTKLFVQLIPPGFTEDEFKELVNAYEAEIDYFAFRPGKIIRDSYGHLIGNDCPNYGFAVLNFKNARTCPKFHREFHQFQLSDSYNIQTKLFVEFALIQETPKISNSENIDNNSASFRDLAVFKEFLEVFPFAAKAEEDRLAAIEPVKIDLEAIDKPEVLTVSPKSNPLDVKLPVQFMEAPQISFLTLISNNSTEAVTPLTNYMKELALDKELPPASIVKTAPISKSRNCSDKYVDNNKKEVKNAKTDKVNDGKSKKNRDDKRKERQKEHIASNGNTANINNVGNTVNTGNVSGAGNEKAKKRSKPKSSANNAPADSLVEKQPQSSEIKGIPKILGRKQATQVHDTKALEPKIDVPVVTSVHEPAVIQVDARVKTVKKTETIVKQDLKQICPDPGLTGRPVIVLDQFVAPIIKQPASPDVQPDLNDKQLGNSNVLGHRNEDRKEISNNSRKGKSLAERSRPAREPYVSPDDSQHIELVKNAAKEHTKSIIAKELVAKVDPVIKSKDTAKEKVQSKEEVPVKKTFKTKQPSIQQPKAKPAEPQLSTTTQAPANEQQKSNPDPSKLNPKKPFQPPTPKLSKAQDSHIIAPPVEAAKKVFRTSRKVQEIEKDNN